MPFTFSHPAAIIPLRRLRMPLSALAVGAMSPDFAYFIPGFEWHHHLGHTAEGSFYFCIPIGVFVLWLFHALLRGPIVALLPRYQRERLLAVPQFTWRNRWPSIVLAVWIGAATHILWDAWTHPHGLGAELFPVLRSLVAIGPLNVSWVTVLQLGSSIAGLLIVAWCYLRWLKHAPVADIEHLPHVHPTVRTVLLLVFVALLAGTAGVISLEPEYHPMGIYELRHYAERALISGTKVAGLAMVAYSVLWSLLKRDAGAAS
jgi:hypothetical protein